MSFRVASYSTAMAPRGKAIAYWNELVRAQIMNLSIQSHRHRDFRGAITSFTSERLETALIQVEHRQQVSHRGTRANGPAGRGQFLLMHMRSGQLSYQDRSAAALLNTGDCLLISDTEDFRFVSSENTSTLVMRFSQDWLRQRVPGIHRQVGTAVTGNQGWGATLSSAMWNIDPGSAVPDASWQGAVADQVCALMSLLGDHPIPAQSRSSRALYDRVIKLMNSRFADPELKPAAVAASLGISKRHLHGVIAEHGSSFNRSLYRIRLQQARIMLESISCGHLGVAEIAYACGFTSAAHFSRLFKARYQCPPSACRQ